MFRLFSIFFVSFQIFFQWFFYIFLFFVDFFSFFFIKFLFSLEIPESWAVFSKFFSDFVFFHFIFFEILLNPNFSFFSKFLNKKLDFFFHIFSEKKIFFDIFFSKKIWILNQQKKKSQKFWFFIFFFFKYLTLYKFVLYRYLLLPSPETVFENATTTSHPKKTWTYRCRGTKRSFACVYQAPCRKVKPEESSNPPRQFHREKENLPFAPANFGWSPIM